MTVRLWWAFGYADRRVVRAATCCDDRFPVGRSRSKTADRNSPDLAI